LCRLPFRSSKRDAIDGGVQNVWYVLQLLPPSDENLSSPRVGSPLEPHPDASMRKTWTTTPLVDHPLVPVEYTHQVRSWIEWPHVLAVHSTQVPPPTPLVPPPCDVSVQSMLVPGTGEADAAAGPAVPMPTLAEIRSAALAAVILGLKACT
jgi:hypothetical protein